MIEGFFWVWNFRFRDFLGVEKFGEYIFGRLYSSTGFFWRGCGRVFKTIWRFVLVPVYRGRVVLPKKVHPNLSRLGNSISDFLGANFWTVWSIRSSSALKTRSTFPRVELKNDRGGAIERSQGKNSLLFSFSPRSPSHRFLVSPLFIFRTALALTFRTTNKKTDQKSPDTQVSERNSALLVGYFTFYARRIMMIILIIIIILNFLIIIITILLITMLTILLTTISLKNTIPSKHYLQFLSIKKHLVLIRKKNLNISNY